MNSWIKKSNRHLFLYGLFLLTLSSFFFVPQNFIFLFTGAITLLLTLFFLLYKGEKWKVPVSLLPIPMLLVLLFFHSSSLFPLFFAFLNLGFFGVFFVEKLQKQLFYILLLAYLLLIAFGGFLFFASDKAFAILLVYTLFLWGFLFLNLQRKDEENEEKERFFQQVENEKAQLATQNEEFRRQIASLESALNQLKTEHEKLKDSEHKIREEKEKFEKIVLKNEKLAQQIQRQNEKLQKINEQLFSNLHREDMKWLMHVVAEIQEFVQAYSAALYLHGKVHNQWHCISSVNLTSQWMESHFTSQYLDAIAKSPDWIELTSENGQDRLIVTEGDVKVRLTYVLFIPLFYANDCVGIFSLGFLEKPEGKPQWEHLFNGLAQGLFAFQKQMEVRHLIHDLQEKNQALAQHEEELRQNLAALEQAHREMEQVQRELQKLNETLEEKVKERTRELEKALQELKSAQNQLILSEKMAILGQLVANIAHEINTPIGAIKASAENIEAIIPSLLEGLNHFPHLKQQTLLIRLIQEIYQDTQVYTSKEERRLRKLIQKELEAHGVAAEDADQIARRLVEAGFHHSIEPYVALFQDPSHLPVLLNFIYSYGQIKLNISNILLASEKTRKITFALKNYAHTQRHETPVETDLVENIETVLTLYYNQLKHGTEVVRDFPEQPAIIWGYPDRLSQVWTNLISNAIHAMGGKGRLEIRIDEEPTQYLVHVIDNGPGIPPEIQDKIFEPFFTTKGKGEGTGLGLDICRQIVKEHGGEIKVRSEPGFTCFTVLLPKHTPHSN